LVVYADRGMVGTEVFFSGHSGAHNERRWLRSSFLCLSAP
jgi:hypothetical protein